jgi:transcriptional regulator with XRE-family HTH domain
MGSVAESRISRADRRARTIGDRLGLELRQARLIAGLTLAQAADAVRLSASEVSRIERGRAPWVDLPTLARLAAVVGLDLWVRLYPGGEPLRDMAHLALTDAFRAILGPGLMVRAEVPIGDPRDLRAWDLTLEDRRSERCGVELETRLVDAQDQLRRVSRKAADSGLERVVLVVADTRANRSAVQAAASLLSASYVIDDPAAYEALARGDVPPRSALILVKMPRPRRRTSLPSHGS